MGKCLRIVFAIFNSLIFLGGCVLLGLAIWLHVNPESLYEFVDVTADQVNNSKSSAEFEQALEILDASVYFAIAIGAFMILVGFLGCAGAACNNRCLLYTFLTIMVLLILGEIAIAIVSFVKYPVLDNFMTKRFNLYELDQQNLIVDGKVDADKAFNNNFVDVVQTSLTCCGWEALPAQNSTVFPNSCCSINEVVCDDFSKIHDTSCESDLKTVGWIIGGVAAGCVVVELLAAIAAGMIARNKKRYA